MAKADVEEIKENSNFLRGKLNEDLASETTHFDEEGRQLIKFHGIYQQEDRDSRKERKKQNLEPLYFFMVRTKVPGGKLTAEQYLVHDELADRFANGTIRLTSRQGIQFHGILKPNLRSHIRTLNEALVSTLAACGDVERNVMCCPAPIYDNSVRNTMQALTDQISEHLAPRTSAYHEIWLNGERALLHKQSKDIEPIYGKHYLPRKFKTAIALPEDNCVDVLSNDLAILAIHQNGAVIGYDIYVGGGMGMTHGMEKTYPRLASPLCFATPDEVIDVITAVVKVQRDFGNREDRKQARLKYLVDKWGTPQFRAKVEEYYGKPTQDPTGTPITGLDDHLGWHSQGDGKYWFGVHVLSGRIADYDGRPLKSGLRDLIRKYRMPVRITAQQDLLLCDIEEQQRQAIQDDLQQAGFQAPTHNLLRSAMACPAIPTCGLALADSERVLPTIINSIYNELATVGLSEESIVLHMTGCPNGCARPYNSDIGIVGRSPGKYKLFIGGNHLGTALSYEYQDLVPMEQIPKLLRGPFLYFKQARRDGEKFGEFCHRVGAETMRREADALLAANS